MTEYVNLRLAKSGRHILLYPRASPGSRRVAALKKWPGGWAGLIQRSLKPWLLRCARVVTRTICFELWKNPMQAE